MAYTSFAEPPVEVAPPPMPSAPPPQPQQPFLSLVPSEGSSLGKARAATLLASVALHSVLLAAVVLVPILAYDTLPAAARDTLRAFLVEPTVVLPPPPPPPPPAGILRAPKAVSQPVPVPRQSSLIAPVEMPDRIVPALDTLDFGEEGGVPGGVEGGVEGGVLGGVVGGIVGGLPQAIAPPAPPRVVRVGGQVSTPKLIREVRPSYPSLALMARVSSVVILEARVDAQGYVKSADVLVGNQLFDEAAVSALLQWRYQPLLLNGIPTEFIVNVTMVFRVRTPIAE